MSDDLVKRLRAMARAEHDDLPVADEAADRIEALERERTYLAVEASKQQARIALDVRRTARREALTEAIALARGWRKLPPGALSTDSLEAARQAADEIATAIRALIDNPERGNEVRSAGGAAANVPSGTTPPSQEP